MKNLKSLIRTDNCTGNIFRHKTSQTCDGITSNLNEIDSFLTRTQIFLKSTEKILNDFGKITRSYKDTLVEYFDGIDQPQKETILSLCKYLAEFSNLTSASKKNIEPVQSLNLQLLNQTRSTKSKVKERAAANSKVDHYVKKLDSLRVDGYILSGKDKIKRNEEKLEKSIEAFHQINESLRTENKQIIEAIKLNAIPIVRKSLDILSDFFLSTTAKFADLKPTLDKLDTTYITSGRTKIDVDRSNSLSRNGKIDTFLNDSFQSSAYSCTYSASNVITPKFPELYPVTSSTTRHDFDALTYESFSQPIGRNLNFKSQSSIISRPTGAPRIDENYPRDGTKYQHDQFLTSNTFKIDQSSDSNQRNNSKNPFSNTSPNFPS